MFLPMIYADDGVLLPQEGLHHIKHLKDNSHPLEVCFWFKKTKIDRRFISPKGEKKHVFCYQVRHFRMKRRVLCELTHQHLSSQVRGNRQLCFVVGNLNDNPSDTEIQMRATISVRAVSLTDRGKQMNVLFFIPYWYLKTDKALMERRLRM